MSKIETVQVRQNLLHDLRTIYDSKTNENTDKFLIEFFNIKNGDFIFVKGIGFSHDVENYNRLHTNQDLVASIPIVLKWKDIGFKIIIHKSTPIISLKCILEQNYDFVPGFTKIMYNDVEQNDHAIVSQLISEGNNVFNVEGTPLPNNFTHLENNGIKVSADCIICFEKITNPKFFKCGHANVCKNCPWNDVNHCPCCKQ